MFLIVKFRPTHRFDRNLGCTLYIVPLPHRKWYEKEFNSVKYTSFYPAFPVSIQLDNTDTEKGLVRGEHGMLCPKVPCSDAMYAFLARSTSNFQCFRLWDILSLKLIQQKMI